MNVTQPRKAVTVGIPAFKFVKQEVFDQPLKLESETSEFLYVDTNVNPKIDGDSSMDNSEQINDMPDVTVKNMPKNLTPTQRSNPIITFLEDNKFTVDILDVEQDDEKKLEEPASSFNIQDEIETAVVFAPTVKSGYKPLMPELVAQSGVTYQEAELVIHGPPSVKRGLRRR